MMEATVAGRAAFYFAVKRGALCGVKGKVRLGWLSVGWFEVVKVLGG